MANLNKKVNLTINTDLPLNDVRNSVKSIQSMFDGLDLSKSTNKELTKIIASLSGEINNFEALANKGLSSLSDTTKIQNSLSKVEKSFFDLDLIAKRLGKESLKDLLPTDLQEKFTKVKSLMNDFVKSGDKIQANSEQILDIENKRTEALTKQNTELEKTKNLSDKIVVAQEKVKSLQSQEKTDTLKTSTLQAELDNAEKRFNQAKQKQASFVPDPKAKGLSTTQQKGLNDEVDRSEKAYNAAKIALKENIAALSEYNEKILTAKSELLKLKGQQISQNDATQKATTTVNKYTKALQDLNDENSNLSKFTFDQLVTELQKAGVEIDESVDDLDKLKLALESMEIKEVEKISTVLDDIQKSAEQASPPIEELGNEVKGATTELKKMSDAERDIDRLKTQLQEFFSISNTVELFKRTIASAFDTVKDLDAAMTETAVVTDKSIGDMWNNLPKYTKAANDLGATTLGAYETMTLYYQQGGPSFSRG